MEADVRLGFSASSTKNSRTVINELTKDGKSPRYRLPSYPLNICFVAGFAEQFLTVSNVYIDSDGISSSLDSQNLDWQYTSEVRIPGEIWVLPCYIPPNHCSLGTKQDISVTVQPAAGQKCPRCWMYTREPEHTLCHRCSDVIGQ